jgi:hypothetical protein
VSYSYNEEIKWLPSGKQFIQSNCCCNVRVFELVFSKNVDFFLMMCQLVELFVCLFVCLCADFVQEEQKCPDKLDVWLYGNLLYEIITNTNLYLNPLQMFDEDSSFQDQPFLTGDETHPILLTLMKQCWNLDPEQRPAFFQIVQTLKVANITSSDISQNQ